MCVCVCRCWLLNGLRMAKGFSGCIQQTSCAWRMSKQGYGPLWAGLRLWAHSCALEGRVRVRVHVRLRMRVPAQLLVTSNTRLMVCMCPVVVGMRVHGAFSSVL